MGSKLMVWSNYFVNVLNRPKKHTMGLAFMRVIFSLSILIEICINFPDRRFIWDSDPVFLKDLKGAGMYLETFTSLFKTKSTLSNVDFFLISLFILSLLFMFGIMTNITNICLWIFYYHLYMLNTTISDGGQTLLGIMLFYLIFVDTSQYFSLDAFFRKKFFNKCILYNNTINKIRPYNFILHNMFFSVMCIQIVIVYTVSGLTKIQGQDWIHGTAIYYILHQRQFSVWPEINIILEQPYMQYVIVILTYCSALFQVFFGLLLLNKYTKAITIVFMFAMHISIGIFMGLGVFSLIMLGSEFIFIPDKFFKKIIVHFRSNFSFAK